MELELIKIDYPEGMNIILGQSHFIKTVEDLYEALITSCPGIRFGLAFSEASGPCLIRKAGNNPELTEIACQNLLKLSAGHSFLIILENAFPIFVLSAVRSVSEVCNIFCATGNPVKAVIARDGKNSGILGVIDGFAPKGIEDDEDIKKRKDFLRNITGYKL